MNVWPVQWLTFFVAASARNVNYDLFKLDGDAVGPLGESVKAWIFECEIGVRVRISHMVVELAQ